MRAVARRHDAAKPFDRGISRILRGEQQESRGSRMPSACRASITISRRHGSSRVDERNREESGGCWGRELGSDSLHHCAKTGKHACLHFRAASAVTPYPMRGHTETPFVIPRLPLRRPCGVPRPDGSKRIAIAPG
jgi:hypothetical protein